MKINPAIVAAVIALILVLVFIFRDGTKATASSFLSSRHEGFIPSGMGTHYGDSISGEELYLDKYDHMMEGIDPEMQASQDEYTREQDEVIVSRGAAGPYATELDHFRPPNTPHGLTGFRQFWHDTYTLPDARQVPSDDPGQYYSSNPSGYLVGQAM